MDKSAIMHILGHTIDHTVMISSFVFVMMLIIEYINIQTKGLFTQNLRNHPWRQYLLAGLLGILPGCLGSFSVVALYSHGVMSFGALVTTMIATAGDEAFVMIGLVPETVMVLFPLLFVIAIVTGWVLDRFFQFSTGDRKFEIHQEEAQCGCFNPLTIRGNFKNLTLQRGVLILLVSMVMVVIFIGTHDLQNWDWKRITFLILNFVSLFIVVTVPEHFLEKHLWEHNVKRHLPQIIGWTFMAIFFAHLLIDHLNVAPWMEANLWLVLLIACLVGLIPESGPHLVFLSFYAQGVVPFSVLLASSIVQDGHGMLPLLAESRKKFMIVKLINFAVGLFVGAVALIIEKWI
ncbi:MAG: arsenic efflux protein [Candidatus Marinimicrobia bacterium]|nr:arsenic efflux protein [Candidatus Neomarinimicrobiota bacterium]